jgi:glycosyltransferase involved in cell wall biosynthesis
MYLCSMRLAVFFYADTATENEDTIWLQHLLYAMVQQAEQHVVLLFTNNTFLLSTKHERIALQQYAVPTGLLLRRRTLRRWQQGAQSAGAAAAVCIGAQSFSAGALPTYVILLPTQAYPPKMMQAARTGAAGIWVNNGEAKKKLEQQGIPNILVLPGGPMHEPLNKPVDAEIFKEEYTDGSPYFLYAGPMAATPPLIGLLKAFSKFKHRQKSSWKLVLLPLGADPDKIAALKDLLASYKYRYDVVLPEQAVAQSKAAFFFRAAYAFVQPLPVGPYGSFLHDAIGAALPIIATSEPLHKEVAGNAALYYEAGDEQLLATCLMQVYKDEALHSRLAEAARQAAAQTGWKQTAAIAWQSLAGAEK